MSSKCDVCFTSVIGLSNVIFLFVNLCYQIALFSNSLHSHSIPGSPVSWLITSQGHCNPHSSGLDFLGQFGLHKLANKRDRSFPYNIQKLHLCFDFVPDIPIHIIFSHIDFFVTEYHKHWFQPPHEMTCSTSQELCTVCPGVLLWFHISHLYLRHSALLHMHLGNPTNVPVPAKQTWVKNATLSGAQNSYQFHVILFNFYQFCLLFKWFIGMNISQFDSWIQFLILIEVWLQIGCSSFVRVIL